jgi:hypothetical protein
MKKTALIMVCLLTIFICKSQISFTVNKIIFDKAVEHRVANDVWIYRHATPPYLSMECSIINQGIKSKTLVLDIDTSAERFNKLPRMFYSYKHNKKQWINSNLASWAFPYELSKKKKIILQPNDTLNFTLENSFLFVQLYNKIFAHSHGDRQLSFEQLLKIIPTLQITYINKYAKEEDIKELKAEILPVDKITLEAEPQKKPQPVIRIDASDTNEETK